MQVQSPPAVPSLSWTSPDANVVQRTAAAARLHSWAMTRAYCTGCPFAVVGS
jgi:hypothetical protein